MESHGVPARERSFIANMRQVLSAASPVRRIQLAATLVLTLAGAIAELVTIGAVLPLLAIAAAPEKVGKLPVVGGLLSRVSSGLGVTPMITAALFLVVASIAATCVRLATSWATQKFTYGLKQDLVMTIYGRALRQPYGWYVRQNSSVLISGVEKIFMVTIGVISPLLTAATSGFMAVCVTAFLFVIDPVTASIAAATIGAIYVGISFYSRGSVKIASEQLAASNTMRVKAMQETLGGIRDIILDQSQPVFEARLLSIENQQRKLFVLVNFLGLAPRLIVEGGSIVLIAVIAAWFSLQPGGVLAAIPVLGALALGAQRLLPMIQLVYLGWNNYSVHSGSLSDVVDLLNAPVESADELPVGATVKPFRSSLELRQVGFHYNADRAALSDVNMTIAKGDRIGLIGKTGSGKSTLVDIVMGLLQPTSGAILIDGEPRGAANLANWKAQVAHVPQAIFLSDDTIAANVAFGSHEDDIDHDRVDRALRDAGLADFIAELPDGLRTGVGERGVRLSGGQRQRLGIARALYKQATVLVLDEATSALDDQTEAEVMSSVEALDASLTIILIAHRLSTVRRCGRVYRLENGRIAQQGSYEEIVQPAAVVGAGRKG